MTDFSRSFAEIDEDLHDLAIRERGQRERLLGAITELDRVARRRERLLDERIVAAQRASRG